MQYGDECVASHIYNIRPLLKKNILIHIKLETGPYWSSATAA